MIGALVLASCLASGVHAQTTNYSIPAGSGTLTYTETVSSGSSCPLNEPPTAYATITSYTFNNFAYNGQSLSGSITYLSLSGSSSYCPPSGWQGPIPYPMSTAGIYVFFTPSLGGAGSATTNALTVSANPSPGVFGGGVQLTANEQFPNASGTVTFMDGSTTLGTATMANQVAALSVSLATGTHSITASFTGNVPNVTSPAIPLVINQATPSVSWPTPAAITYGTALSGTQLDASASVAGSFSYSPAAGSVLTAGTHTLSATFTPTDTTDYTGATGSVTITVNHATPAASLSCSPNPVTYVPSGSGTLTTCTATVNAPGSTANVVFTYNGNSWTTQPLSNQTASASGFAPGTAAQSFTVVAAYAGDSNYSAVSPSTTFTVSQASQSISSFTATATSSGPYGVGTMSLSASASSGLGVTFSVLSGLGSISGSTLTINGTGSITIAANQAGNANYAAAPQVTQTINVGTNNGSSNPGLGTVSYQEFTTSYTCGQYSQTLTQYEFTNFSYSGPNGMNQSWPGNAIYYLSSPGTTGCPPSGWQGPNPYILSGTGFAVYVNETSGSPSITTSIDTLTMSPPYGATWTYGTSLTFTATQLASGATGSTTFYDGSTALATVALASGQASYSTQSLPVGTHTISATYISNDGYPSEASPSITETITQTAQSITFTSSSTATYGQAPITLTATGGGSGNPIIFTLVSGLGTISGNTLTIIGAGTIVVAANQAGNSNYTAAPQVTQNIVVSKASQSISFAAPSSPVVYGVSPISLSASGGGSGNPVIFSIVSGRGSISGNTLTITGAGTVVIAANQQGNGNYAPASQVTQTITVNQATPTISPWPAASTITYGQTLASSTLSGGSASVGGSFVFTTPSTAPGVGSALQSVTFTPSDITDYNTVTGSVNVPVSQATPTISAWPTASPIASGQTLASSTLSGGSASVGGSFVFTTPSTSPGAGFSPQPVTFTPTDTTDYTTVSGSVSVMVAPGPGIIITIAGNGNAGYSGDQGPAPTATLDDPYSIVVDGAGDIFFVDFQNSVVREISAQTGIINTVAGNGSLSYSGDGGPATSAGMEPAGIALDSAGNLYIADLYNNRVRKVTFSNGVGTITTIAGNGSSYPYSGSGVPATNSSLTDVNAVAVDAAGNVYIAQNCLISKVSNGIITTVVGYVASGYENGSCGFSGDGGAATSAQIEPWGLAVDTAGNLYIAEGINNRIRKVTFNGSGQGTITTVAGSGAYGENSGSYSGDDGAATSATLNFPMRVAVDATGNLYIADTYNNVIRKVLSDGIIATIAGNGTLGFAGDGGPATAAELGRAMGVAVAPNGAVYVSDGTNNRIREVAVSQIAPSITWPALSAISYGTALSSTQLSASTAIPGTFTYNPPAATVLQAGTHTLSATFTPNDTTDFSAVTVTAPLTVNQVNPTIAWAAPAAIPYGTALSATQLNATATGVTGASLPGTFSYAPPVGTVLSAEPHTLTATFTPTDTTDYNIAIAQVTEIVTPVSGSKSDTGTIALTVGGVNAGTTTYAAGDTPSTIAEKLASSNQGLKKSNVTVNAVDDTLYVQAKSGYVGTDYSYSLQTTSYDSTDFSQPSFVAGGITGALEGATNPTSSSAPVYGYNNTYDHAGNLISSNDPYVMGSWRFAPDTLNRLVSGSATTLTYAGQSLCWGYDQFGNRTAQDLQTTACPSLGTSPTPTASFNSNNQVTWTTVNTAVNGFTYDAAGNVLNDNVNQYLYDGDGRICAVASSPIPGMTTMTGYIYDASGTRVAKGRISSWSCDPSQNGSGFQTINDYVLGLNGEQVTEMGLNTQTGGGSGTLTWQHTNVFAAGTLIGTYDNDGLHFYLNDVLGTRRVQTDYAGVPEQNCSSLPFGDGLSCAPPNQSTTDYYGSIDSPTEHHFTGKERDTESGNDYFGARYYSSAMGRFMSPDWSAQEEPVPYAKLDDPQTLNLYSYVGNNPLARVDADGHCPDGCVIEGGAALVTVAVIGAIALEAGAVAYNNSPAGQRSLNGAWSTAKENFSSNLSAVKNKVTSIFNSEKKPGTKGKPDHQETVKEEAKKIGGDTEVRIPTPGGSKETRVGDAVAKDANGNVTSVTQVIRPTPAGNVPKRETDAANDIQNATGVKPTLVPVRPLPH